MKIILLISLFMQLSATSMAKTETTKPSPTFEEAWPTLEEAFNNLTSMADGSSSYIVTSEDYMNYNTIVYEACERQQVDVYQKFYNAYKKSFEDYISSKILPLLQGIENDDLDLTNLVRSWSNYKLVTNWFFRFMNYLGRYYLPQNNLPTLEQTSYLCFYDKIYGGLNDKITSAVLSMIRDERKGNKIDDKLLKDILKMYKEMAKTSKQNAHYKVELEEAMFRDAEDFYYNKALEWTATISSDEDYMQKVSECLEEERNRVSLYLEDKTMDELLKVIERELLAKTEIASNQATA